MGWEIISTGGTAHSLREAGVRVKDISELTGFPEILDGRLKTLHPKVHGGILGRRDLPFHGEQMDEHGIEPIDLVAVNLYPFSEVIARGDDSKEAWKLTWWPPYQTQQKLQTDHRVEPSASPCVEELRREGDVSLPTRFKLAVDAFSYTAYYDSIISNYLRQFLEDKKERFFPRTITFPYVRVQDLRYGENPQQRAAFYREPLPSGASIALGRQLQGKSFPLTI